MVCQLASPQSNLDSCSPFVFPPLDFGHDRRCRRNRIVCVVVGTKSRHLKTIYSRRTVTEANRSPVLQCCRHVVLISVCPPGQSTLWRGVLRSSYSNSFGVRFPQLGEGLSRPKQRASLYHLPIVSTRRSDFPFLMSGKARFCRTFGVEANLVTPLHLASPYKSTHRRAPSTVHSPAFPSDMIKYPIPSSATRPTHSQSPDRAA